MIHSLVPPQLVEIIVQLETAQKSGSLDENGTEHLVSQVDDVEEHLRLVAQPNCRRDKGFERDPPTYVFGPLNARKANQALFNLNKLRTTLDEGDLGAALKVAREIRDLFGE